VNRRGVCYDVGRVMWGQDWRPEFSPEEARRELQIIRDDLHCNAVRICGQDLGRLMAAGKHALDHNLQVWLSPELWDHSPSQTLDYIATAADAAQDLHRDHPGQVVFSVGSEATLLMAGIVEGGSVFERLEHPDFWKRVQAGEHNQPLNTFLAQAAERVRGVFHGPVTYASVPLETVEWSRFDYVSVDFYRGAELKDRFTDVLHRYFAFDRPVAITEFGCCTYRGSGCRRWQGIRHPRHHRTRPEQHATAAQRPIRPRRIRAGPRAHRDALDLRRRQSRRHLRHDVRRPAQPHQRRSALRPRYGQLQPRQELRRPPGPAWRRPPRSAVGP